MFIDEVIITVKAGNGGDGSAAFRREKFIQFGGPDGGDGGKGGDVVFVADSNINTLIDFKFKKLFKAQNGENGQKKQMYGKKGEDLIIRDGEFVKKNNILSSGTKAGLDIVYITSAIKKNTNVFYYCDEKFPF